MFDSSDLLNLGERVKHLNIVSFAQGYVSVYKGHKAAHAKDYVSCTRYYEQALVAYQAALDSSPNDPSLLRSCARVYLEIEKAVLSRHGMSKRRLRDSPYLIRADFFYRQSLEQNNGAPEATALAEYGSFLEHCREFDAAETYYLRSLTIDPNHLPALKQYATFLQEVRQSISLGDRFLARYEDNTRFLTAQGSATPIVAAADVPPSNAAGLAKTPVRPATRPRSLSQDQGMPAEHPRTRTVRSNSYDLSESLDRSASRSTSGLLVAIPRENSVEPIVENSNNTSVERRTRTSRSSSLSEPESSESTNAILGIRIKVSAFDGEVAL